jgi:nickel superoxide dismutase
MNTLLPSALVIGALALVATPRSQPAAPAPAATPATAPAALPHCQVPCGIYGDQMRIDMLMEDAATIEKGMKTLTAEGADAPVPNQMVRWVMTKDQHAQSIQDTVAAYWLAQRIKAPAAGDAEARDRYHRQLELMHGITVAAMKCKQTTDTAHVETLRKLALEFSGTYFSAEDLEHIRAHHGQDR